MAVDNVAIIGAGTMGSGIAQVFLQHGFSVVLIDRDEEQLGTAVEQIREGLHRVAQKEEPDEDAAEEFMGDLTVTTNTAAVEGVGLILEAVPEDLDIKANVFEDAAGHNTDAVYASNTSSIPISKLVKHAPEPARCIGMHFFNPAPVMDVVEVVCTEETSDETVETVTALCSDLGKEPAQVQDVPGFVSNRILMPFINEAIKTLEQDIADKESIDTIAAKGFNHPMGPLELADFIGLDVCLDIMDRMYEETGEDRFRPADLLREKVDQEKLGKKNGEGFYVYD